jgi:hypothetical protein
LRPEPAHFIDSRDDAAGAWARRHSGIWSPAATITLTSTGGLRYAMAPHCEHSERERCSGSTTRSMSGPPHWPQKRGIDEPMALYGWFSNRQHC